jgi:hypothetical protein
MLFCGFHIFQEMNGVKESIRIGVCCESQFTLSALSVYTRIYHNIIILLLYHNIIILSSCKSSNSSVVESDFGVRLLLILLL